MWKDWIVFKEEHTKVTIHKKWQEYYIYIYIYIIYIYIYIYVYYIYEYVYKSSSIVY